MKIETSAPSNIAMIKYMGKLKGASNLPTNASFSYTLDHMRSFVTLELGGEIDVWQPLSGFTDLRLSAQGIEKFLRHFDYLKKIWNISGHYLVQSGNNFPADCGLASSASSYAALTTAAYELALRNERLPSMSASELSKVSRLGSGSSCRSFFSPWALWRGEGGERVDLDLKLEHAVVVLASEKKAVSSSVAHQRVASSLLFAGRASRAERRLEKLLPALTSGSWSQAFELCWSEFWDMHALFETSQPAFGYLNSASLQFLNQMRGVWSETGDGPLVTMDAGANVHILIRPEQKTACDAWLSNWNSIKSWN